MNVLDAVVLLGTVAAAVVGFRVGLTTRVLSWAGLAAGIALGVLFVDDDAETTFRAVFVLAASLAPGDSGGPLFDQHGRVVGLAFAVDPGSSTTAYALTTSEIDKGLRAARGPGGFVPVDTGRCIAG